MEAKTNRTIILFFIGTIVTAAGWVVTHTISTVLSVPTLEYQINIIEGDQKCKKTNGPNSISVIVRNLSKNTKFDSIIFLFRHDTSNNSKFWTAELYPKQPLYPTRNAPRKGPKAITFPTTPIYPGTELVLFSCYFGLDEPTFHIGPESSNLRPLKKGIETFLIHNELIILTFLLGVWVLFVLVFLFLANLMNFLCVCKRDD